VFVNRTDGFNRYEAEIIGPECLLPSLNIGAVEKAVKYVKMLNPDLSAFRLKVSSEKIAIEVIAQLAKQRVEIGLGIRSGLPSEYVFQVFRAVDVKRIEVGPVDDAAVKQVAGENQSAKKCIEYPRLKLWGLDLTKLLPRRVKVAEQISVNSFTWIEGTPVNVKMLTRFNGQQERPKLILNAVQPLDKSRCLPSSCESILRGN
jgi:hypothetical protein